jgi:TRC40/GET3/ArsA family transport-energizing ATPase
MRTFNLSDIELTKYLFFTGKGGVGKTSIACATAVGLADNGKKILLISTDPASNLQDVFNQTLNGHGTDIQEVPGLTVVNLDPEQAAAEYRESVIAPFRGKLPDSVIQNMEEQLSGSCTVEIAAFNQFSDFITDADKAKEYDHIIFDTAPTGHTLRMLQLPSAWSTFISESTHGASCLGQLSGLEERKGIYKQAVETLSDANATRLVLVSRPEIAPLKEAARSSHELQLLGINNQLLVINGLLLQLDEADSVSKQIYDRQQTALKQTPAELLDYPSYSVPLRSYNLSNIANIRRMLYDDNLTDNADYQRITDAKGIDELVNDLYQSGKRVVFTMGKGGVGKTTLATEIDIENVTMNDADEVFWRCNGIRIKNLKLHSGTYPFMFSNNIYVDGLESNSKYVFQYVKNVEIHHAKITTKDAFWEVENVTIYDSELNGEYLGWHSKNLRLVNCHITGEQPLCYAHDLILENCTFGPDCDRTFEYSTLQADIHGAITNIKNPMSGCIVADEFGSITIDENIKAPADCEIRLRDERTCFTD